MSQTTTVPTAVGTCHSLSRAVSAVLAFIAVSALETVRPGEVFVGAAVIMGPLCLDVGLLGRRSTGSGAGGGVRPRGPQPCPG